MRRGLKQIHRRVLRLEVLGRFKPIPDEEGTETYKLERCRAHHTRFKPIPDEEGTETKQRRRCHDAWLGASNRSPMRRGLKLASHWCPANMESGFKPIPDEEGTETEKLQVVARAAAELQTDPR